ncbi:hypothetical protein INR99_01250 [Chitinilyticum litopenaei]|uniref:CNP1-like uncharacterized domain-containing protein n=2 Tax=Chitinilyticum piscinae TaxID=2866724 RepID=A0A8J7K7F3_9NEIS|nr:hypothetical protein [Chitinilyticum piscinae]
MRRAAIALSSILLLASPLSQATEYDSGRGPNGQVVGDGDSDGGMFSNLLKDGKPAPKEGEYTMPDLAKLKEWAQVTIPHQPVQQNDYAIALDSITVGKDDRIVRYVMMVKSKRGKARNVLFEGLDCFSNQYHTYAWANQQGEWQTFSDPKWKLITKDTHNSWQAELVDEMCQLNEPYKLEAIRSNLKTDSSDKFGCSGCGQQ